MAQPVRRTLTFLSADIEASTLRWQSNRDENGVALADRDSEETYGHGDRSAMIAPLAVYADVLRTLGEADAAAVVRGALPRRLTLMMVREVVAPHLADA